MLASEIREMTDEDIRARIGELEEERFRLRFRSATETLDNPMRLRFVRRDIARLLTVLRERELGVRGQAGAAEPAEAGQRGASGAKGGARRAARPAAKRAGKGTGKPAAKKATAKKATAKKATAKRATAPRAKNAKSR